MQAVIDSEYDCVSLTFSPNSVELRRDVGNTEKRFMATWSDKLPSIEPKKITRISYEGGSGIKVALVAKCLPSQEFVPSIKTSNQHLLAEGGVCVIECVFCRSTIIRKK